MTLVQVLLAFAAASLGGFVGAMVSAAVICDRLDRLEADLFEEDDDPDGGEAVPEDPPKLKLVA